MLSVPAFSRLRKEVIGNIPIPINVFYIPEDGNIDHKTVESFGEEWKKFNTFEAKEIAKIGSDYFDILPLELLRKDSTVLDVGCGSGRWATFLAPLVGHIDCIDPSNAVFTASNLLGGYKNVRISKVDIENVPFDDNSFDLVYSLGVLHHIPDTFAAMQQCVAKVKKGGYFLVYLYYRFDNRGILFKTVFKLSAILRKMISALPSALKKIVCEVIALLVYWPIARFAALLYKAGAKSFSKKIPLSYYWDKSFWIMKNDALDRFGTPLEQRFTKSEISKMMAACGLTNIRFSDKEPYWHAIGQKL